ncbi:hypothetical protein HOP50_10g58370 [Chloropicon primus]|uniref:Galactose oxidase n=1 Tax=Chloropicon primus TaxID=1764295 RepID=A0A5B8MRT0_9CHLO|nr:hypothetical protein A3770_10p58170 [Chloropicon primus]UPR02511.1 hypothetical protein HOP50_10g58370 [Chloropicon primus]|eukprot:QDZ23299.1 hypothetical protein A3770_10p58170 [Chloropicon primus]
MVRVDKPIEGNFFEPTLEEKLKSSPGMPPTAARPRPKVERPQSAGKRATLFSKYGKVGDGFRKFQDNIKHLQTPTPPKPKGTRPSRSNKVLPIGLGSSSPSPPGKNKSFLTPQQDGKEKSKKGDESGSSGPSPPAGKTPPMPKSLNWKSIAKDLTKDLTFSQKRHHRRRQKSARSPYSKQATPSPVKSPVVSVPEKAVTKDDAGSKGNAKGKKLFEDPPPAKPVERKSKSPAGQAKKSEQKADKAAKGVKKQGLNFDERFPLSVSHALYDNLDAASTSKPRRRIIKGEFSLNWVSHLKTNGSVPSNRMGHSQTSANFSLVVFGGATGGKFMNDLWIFNSETCTWCKKPAIGSVPSARGYHTTSLLDRGRRGDKEQSILLFGGWDGRFMFNDLYVVDNCEDLLYRKSAYFRQVKAGNAPVARAMHTMTTVYLGDSSTGYEQALILFGGWSRQSFLNDMHVYSVANEAWTKVTYKQNSDVPDKRGSHTAVAVKDQLYVFGGQKEEGPCNDLWTFSIQTRAWTLINQQGAVPSPRSGHSCVLVEDRYILLFGGYNGDKHLSDMYMLDTDSMQWEQKSLPLGHPLGRSAHQMSLVGGTRVYMTFGWSPHGVLCDIHALDTRAQVLKKISVTGGPYSSTLCQLSVEFTKEKEKSAPISIRWHRSKNGKPYVPIEGAVTSVYMPTADDVNASIGVSCMPCERTVPLGPSYFAFTQQIEVDPEMGGLVKSLVGQDKAKFSVNLLSAENVVAKMYLIFTSSSFELRTKSKTSFKEEYQTSFRVILSSQNPYTFVLQVHQGLSLPFAVQHIMERDLLALVARSYWALALKRML